MSELSAANMSQLDTVPKRPEVDHPTPTDVSELIAAKLSQLDTVPKRLEFISKRYPDRELFVFCSPDGGREAYTAGRLLDLAGKFAGRLLVQGFTPGQVIANTLINSPERVVTDLGVVLAGGISMNGQVLLADGSDFFHSARKSRCDGVILCPEESSPAWRLLASVIVDQDSSLFSPVSSDQASDLTTAVLVRPRRHEKSLLASLETSDDVPHVHPCQADDIMQVFNTSGSTGYSKLVHRTHREILHVCAPQWPLADTLLLDRGVVFYDDRPLAWIGGFPFTTYAFGDTRVLTNQIASHKGMDTGELFSVLAREGCNTTIVFPAQIEVLARWQQDSNKHKHFRFRRLLTGAQPLRKSQIIDAFRLADTVINIYGATETFFMSTETLHKDNYEFEDCCCGEALPGVNIKVVDDSEQECAVGVMGTILAKGERLFAGYFNRQQRDDPDTAAAISADGWVSLGDYGYRGPDDKIYVMGRNKDVIMHGFTVLYPGWLESRIQTHVDVLEAVVLPVSDRVICHKICACVRTPEASDLDEAKLEEFCRDLFVADLKCAMTPLPEFYMVLKGSDFPITSTGKPDKQKLKKMAEDFFGHNEMAEVANDE